MLYVRNLRKFKTEHIGKKYTFFPKPLVSDLKQSFNIHPVLRGGIFEDTSLYARIILSLRGLMLIFSGKNR